MGESTKLLNLIIARRNWNSLRKKNICRLSLYPSKSYCSFHITYAGHRFGILADTNVMAKHVSLSVALSGSSSHRAWFNTQKLHTYWTGFNLISENGVSLTQIEPRTTLLIEYLCKSFKSHAFPEAVTDVNLIVFNRPAF